MRWRRIALLSLGLVAVFGIATALVLQRADAATTLLQRELQAWLRPRATLQSTAIDASSGRLTVRGLRIEDPQQAGRALLTVDALHADVGTAIALPPVDLHALHIDGLALEFGPRLPDPAALLAKPAGDSSGSATAIPVVMLRDGRVTWTAVAGQPPLELRNLQLRAGPRDGDADHVELRGQAEIAELGLALQLAGEFDLVRGGGTLALRTGDMLVDDARVRRFAALAGAKLPELTVGARLRGLSVVLHLPPREATATAPWCEAEAVFEHLRVIGPELPAVARDATLTVTADTRNGISATVRLEQRDDGGALELTARGTDLLGAQHIDVRGHGTDLRFDEEVRRALNTFPVGREIMRALAPVAGRADLDLFLSEPHMKGAGFEQLDLSLRDIQLAYQGFGPPEKRAAFPLPLEHASGRVRLRDNVVLVENVRAQIAASAGGGTVELHGYNEVKKPAGEDTWLDIEARGVQFTPDLRRALGALLRDDGALYDRLAPSGRADVTVQVRPDSLLESCWAVEVRPQDAAMTWAGFPLRLDAVQGSVRARNDDVVFDLRGNHGDGRLTLRGRIPIDSTREDPLGFDAVVGLTGVAVDDDLRTAVAVMAPKLEPMWRASNARGRLAGEVKVWRARLTDPLSYDASLQVEAVDLDLPAAPWRATGMHGQIVLQGQADDVRLDFDSLRGELGHDNGRRSPLAMLGHLDFGTNARTDLAFVVRDLELDGQLGSTLESLQALGPGTWDSLRPSGRIDFVTRFEQAPATPDQLRLVVHLVDVHSAASILPHPAEHMTGELTIAAGELRFHDVRATLGGAPVRCTDGRVRTLPAPDERTEIAFTVQATGAPVDDGLANLFTGPLRDAVLARKLRGRADTEGLRLVFALPRQRGNPAFSTTIAGNLRLHEVSMALGTGKDAIVAHGIDGSITLRESTVVDGRGGIEGDLRGVSLRVFNQPCTGIHAPFRADAERIRLGQLTAKLHSGTLTGQRDNTALEYLLPGKLAPEGRLLTNLAFERLDVASFLGAAGWINPPYSGAASGALVLDGLDGANVVGLRAKGRLTIDRADLGVVPLFTAIYAQLPPADRPRFNHLDTNFVVEGGSLRFERLDVQSNVIGAKGKGTLGFDGYLDVEMTLDNLLGDSADPLLMPLIDYFAQNLVTFYLHGYLRDLHAEKRWVTEAPPARRPSVPLPPTRPRPAAPGF